MKAVLDAQDYDVIAAEVKKRLLKDYDLVPKKQSARYVSLPQFKKEHCIKKKLEWCRVFLLPKMPGVYGLNQGKGHHITIDSRKASEWLDEHGDEIDWSQPMP